MTSITEQKPVNRQEFSYYLLIVVLILFLLLITALSLFYTMPKQSWELTRVPVGEIVDYPSTDRPYPVMIEETSLFIIRTGNGWLALDRRTPIPWADFEEGCTFVWEEANGRFVDPCSGSKFTLDGRLLEGPTTQDLNQYPITERAGELFIDLTKMIPGESSE